MTLGTAQQVSRADALLAQARSGWTRLTAPQARQATEAGALLVDVRTERQRAEVGELPGAVVIDLTVLEWRLDPTSRARIPEASADRGVVLICRQGYSSSLAVARLHAIGLPMTTDVIDGVEGWLAAGLPLTRQEPDVRR